MKGLEQLLVVTWSDGSLVREPCLGPIAGGREAEGRPSLCPREEAVGWEEWTDLEVFQIQTGLTEGLDVGWGKGALRTTGGSD